MQEHARFQEALLRRAAEGKLEARSVVRLLAPHTGNDMPGVDALIGWLEEQGTQEAETLANSLCPELCAEIRQNRLSQVLPGLPANTPRRSFVDEGLREVLSAALACQQDQAVFRAKGISGAVEEAIRQQAAEWQTKLAASSEVWKYLLTPRDLAERILAQPGRWDRFSTDDRAQFGRFVAELPQREKAGILTVADWRFRLRGCTSRDEATQVVDELCLWPTRSMAEIVPALLEEPWQRRRALQVLTWRFGRNDTDSWEGLCRWLTSEGERWRRIRGDLDVLLDSRAGELLLLWCETQEWVPREIVEMLRKPCGNISKDRLLALRLKYASLMSAEDMEKLGHVVPTAILIPVADAGKQSSEPVPVLAVKEKPKESQAELRPQGGTC
jgi:hypothetical protein